MEKNETKSGDNEPVIFKIMDKVTDEIIFNCKNFSDDEARCISNYIKLLNRERMSAYVSGELRDVYMSLSGEDQDRAVSAVLKHLKRYVNMLRIARRVSRLRERSNAHGPR